MRSAIFGGTFDPIHNAHLVVARRAAEEFRLDQILVVPAAHPPHKSGVTWVPYYHRVRMAELACEGDPLLVVSRLEEGTVRSYSIDTIEKVRSAMALSDELFFIIGSDAFAEIRTWHRWEDVTRAVCFIAPIGHWALGARRIIWPAPNVVVHISAVRASWVRNCDRSCPGAVRS